MDNKSSKISQYAPLLTIIGLAALGAVALSRFEGYSMNRFMHLFMGLFLLQFSALKLFNVSGFAKGFAKYDLLAMRCRPYGLIYPFLELGLALGYLAGGAVWVYVATFILMGFGGLGVIMALAKGLNTNCACLGTTLKVPLSTVAVTENVSMAVMSVIMFFTAVN
ncbi:MAG: MauE/DoxX family redox-associated membrane protein [Akkermansiaceae bacterium]